MTSAVRTRTVTMEDPLTILHVIDGLGRAGAERSLAEMLPLLRDRGFTQTVACLRRRGGGVEHEVIEAGFDVRFLQAHGHVGRVLELRRIIREIQPHVVHSTLFNADIASRLACIGRPTRALSSLVNTTYDPVRYSDPRVGRVALAAVRFVDAATAHIAGTRFHAITETVKRENMAALRLPAGRVTIVPRGRDPQRLGRPDPVRRARARSALGIEPNDEVVVNVGRQEFQKGQRYLLEALPALLTERPELIVLVVGRDGSATDELLKLHDELNLGSRVRFIGFRSDVPDILAAADVFVFPSLYEGLGGALIEAMALGLPIVASDLPVLREVVVQGRNALLVPPKEAHAIAGALRQLLGDTRLREHLGTSSRNRFEECFTLEKSAAAMAEWYATMASGSRNPTY